MTCSLVLFSFPTLLLAHMAISYLIIINSSKPSTISVLSITLDHQLTPSPTLVRTILSHWDPQYSDSANFCLSTLSPPLPHCCHEHILTSIYIVLVSIVHYYLQLCCLSLLNHTYLTKSQALLKRLRSSSSSSKPG